MNADRQMGRGLIEIRVHGRGGQGNVAAAELLAQAAFLAGKEVQAFPAFGAERTGAPVVAFVRIDDAPVRIRSQVYTPRDVIVQDSTLLAANLAGVVAGLAAGGLVLINAPDVPASIAPALPRRARAVAVPATDIALRTVGRAVPNTTLLGAYAALTKVVPLESVRQAIRLRFTGDLAARNVAAAEEGFAAGLNAPVVAAASADDAPVVPVAPEVERALTIGLVAEAGSSDGPDGYHTGSWRVYRPVWDLAKCNDCRLCEVYCPETVVTRLGPRHYTTGLDFCKGCGLCVAECQPKAITLVREDELVATGARG